VKQGEGTVGEGEDRKQKRGEVIEWRSDRGNGGEAQREGVGARRGIAREGEKRRSEKVGGYGGLSAFPPGMFSGGTLPSQPQPKHEASPRTLVLEMGGNAVACNSQMRGKGVGARGRSSLGNFFASGWSRRKQKPAPASAFCLVGGDGNERRGQGTTRKKPGGDGGRSGPHSPGPRGTNQNKADLRVEKTGSWGRGDEDFRKPASRSKGGRQLASHPHGSNIGGCKKSRLKNKNGRETSPASLSFGGAA